MATRGRPRTRTNNGAAPPTTELGVPDTYMFGNAPAIDMAGNVRPWKHFIDEHEHVPGLRWPNSVNTYGRMRSDTQIAALFTAVWYGISHLRFTLDPNGAKPEMVRALSQDLNVPIKGDESSPRGRMKHRFSHRKHLLQALLSPLYGHMYFEQVGEIVDGMWRLRKLAPRMPQTISQINVAQDGGLVSIQQYPNSGNSMGIGTFGGLSSGTYLDWPEIPVDRLTAYIFQQEGPNWVGRSMLRDCHVPWLIKDRLVRVDAVNHERAGGVPYAEGAPGMNPVELEELNEMMSRFRIGDSSGAALPYGAKLHIAKGTGSDVAKSIQMHDEALARRFLLMLVNLAQGGSNVGSYALGGVFEDFFVVGQLSIAEWYCDTTNEHVIEDWVDYNYGPDEELVPFLCWERSSEDSLGTEALSMLVQRGVITMDDETEGWVRYKWRVPKKVGKRPEITIGGPKQPNEQVGLGQDPAGDPGAQSGTGAPSPSADAPGDN